MAEPERMVKQTDALLRESVKRLSRGCPPELIMASAREDLLGLRPHLEEALAALEDIEGRRDLTDEESARRRAFRMLMQTTR